MDDAPIIRSGHLQQGAVPPDFGFEAEGVSILLSEMRDCFRVLLAFCPKGVGKECEDGMRAARDSWPEFQDRDLVLIVVSPTDEDTLAQLGTAESLPAILVSDEGGDVFAAYGIRDTPVVYLIGKDGTAKAYWDHWPSNEEAFALIDAMPMRQAEVVEHRQAA